MNIKLMVITFLLAYSGLLVAEVVGTKTLNLVALGVGSGCSKQEVLKLETTIEARVEVNQVQVGEAKWPDDRYCHVTLTGSIVINKCVGGPPICNKAEATLLSFSRSMPDYKTLIEDRTGVNKKGSASMIKLPDWGKKKNCAYNSGAITQGKSLFSSALVSVDLQVMADKGAQSFRSNIGGLNGIHWVGSATESESPSLIWPPVRFSQREVDNNWYGCVSSFDEMEELTNRTLNGYNKLQEEWEACRKANSLCGDISDECLSEVYLVCGRIPQIM